ncbi:granzyme M-like [Passer domesticus]|uniref:granzyme M-like n=1 Tax=Passer domesticus TaxID=48849 RepID=UPI0030FDFDCF
MAHPALRAVANVTNPRFWEMKVSLSACTAERWGGRGCFPPPQVRPCGCSFPFLPPPSSILALLLPCPAVTLHPGLLQLGGCSGTRGEGGMGARSCLGPLLLLLLPPLPWGEHRPGGSGVGPESLSGDRSWLQPSIIGGREAEPRSRPYMVSLQFRGVHACGAALLRRSWALTAAHCRPRGSWDKGRLVVGLHKWEKRGASTQTFSIRAACPHPGYNRRTMENDLLLLQLDGKVTLSSTRQLIPLAGREPAPGARCSVAGWGVVDRQGRRLSPTLQELNVTVMDTRVCNNSRFWRGEIAPGMICFHGQRGSAPAKGDSGGPLVCGKRPAVAGVMSFSSKNAADPSKPPVATSTVKYKKWIQKTLRRGCGSGQPKHTG